MYFNVSVFKKNLKGVNIFYQIIENADIDLKNKMKN